MDAAILKQIEEIYDGIIGCQYQIRVHMRVGHDELAEQSMITWLNKLARLASVTPELKHLSYLAIEATESFRVNDILSELETMLGAE